MDKGKIPEELKKEDLHSYKKNGYLTVGNLKEFIRDMPDEGLVLVQRIEDMYFENNGWRVILKEGEHYNWGLQFNEDVKSGKYNDLEEYPNVKKDNLKLFTEDELNQSKDQYLPAWCAVKYKDDTENLYLDLHY